jgi:regulator of sigma E protease
MSLSWQHLLAFLVAVGILVTVHEFGHFWVARKLGFKVLRFSVGFGKALWTRRGRDADQVDPAELPRAFNRRPHWQRILVLLAGPAFNILFAILVLWGLFWVNGVSEVRAVVGKVLPDSPAAQAGMASGDEILALDGQAAAGQGDVVVGLLEGMASDGRVQLTLRNDDGAERVVLLQVGDPVERRRLTEPENLLTGLGFGFWKPVEPARIEAVTPGSAAEEAGLKAGDELLEVDGKVVEDFESARGLIGPRAGETVVLTILREGARLPVQVMVPVVEEGGRRIGRIGIAAAVPPLPQSMLRQARLGPMESLAMGAAKSWQMTELQAKVFWSMLQGRVSLKNLSGPLTIAEYAGESARSGVATFLSFLVLISLSLGFINLLPVPILDGGQVVYQVIEWIKGSPLSERAQVLGQQLGIGMLVLLMGAALYNDILRQFG